MRRVLTREEFQVMFGVWPEDCETDGSKYNQLIIYTGYCMSKDGSVVVEISDVEDCN